MNPAREFVAMFTLRLKDDLAPRFPRAAAAITAFANRFPRLTMNAAMATTKLLRFADSAQRMSQRIGVIGGVLAGVSLMAPIQQAQAYTGQLREIGITADLSGEALTRFIAQSRQDFGRLALETNQSSENIAKAAGSLVAAGMDRGLVDQFLPLIARTATASGASMEDIAKTVFSLNQNLQVAPAEMERALSALVTAGKEGSFELRDMAQYFPQLTAAASAVGMRGAASVNVLAASLQVARRGAGDAAEAATNFRNMLQKMSSPETVAHFAKFGVDLPAIMADAARRNINPMEAVVEQVRRITNGDTFKMGQIFADMQVTNFLNPMLQNLPLYQQILTRAANASAEVIDTDFASQMSGAANSVKRFTELLFQLTDRMGNGFAPVLGVINAGLMWLLKTLNWLDGVAPGVADGVLLVLGGAVAVTSALGMLGAVGPAVAAGFAMMSGAASALCSPIGLVVLAVAALAGVAYVIYRNWEKFAGFFSRMWAGIKRIAAGAVEFIAGLLTGNWGRALSGACTIWGGLGTFFEGLWGSVKQLFAIAWQWLDDVTGGYASRIVAATQFTWQPLEAFFAALWSGVEQVFQGAYETIAGILTGDFTRALDGWKQYWSGMGTYFGTIFDGIVAVFATGLQILDVMTGGGVTQVIDTFKRPFIELFAWLQEKFEWVTQQLEILTNNAITRNLGAAADLVSDSMVGRATGSAWDWSMRQMGLRDNPQVQAGRDAAGNPVGSNGSTTPSSVTTPPTRVDVGGVLRIETAPGMRVAEAQSNSPDVRLQPDRGSQFAFQ